MMFVPGIKKRTSGPGLRIWLLSLLLLGNPRTPGLADAYDLLRLKWHEYLSGGTNLNVADPGIANRVAGIANSANSRWNSMVKTNGRAFLWADASRTNQSEDITASYTRLREMALGWATKGSAVYSNVALGSDVIAALEWMHANRYNESRAKYDNWWDWEIGSPMALNDCMVLMYPLLSGTQITNYCKAIDKFSPSVNMTGANRIWKADVVGVRGVVEKNGAKIAAARDGLSDTAGAGASSVFKYVTSGDGFYQDGSFVQHGKHPYTGGYGISHFHDAIKLMSWLDGSTWAVTDPERTNVLNWCWKSYEPLIYRGAMPSFVRGREISRQSSSGDYSPGRSAINGMLQLARSASARDTARLKRAIKYWDEADTLAALTNYVPLHLVEDAKQLLADTNVLPRGELIGHYQFPAMDRVMHLRPGFAFGLSMFSSRVYNYESINTENLKGWYTGDGTTWLFNNDLTHFTDNYWPTVDPYHLPGTTVDLVARADGWGQTKISSQNWVGGSVMDGLYGAVGMAFKAIDSSSSLSWQKSWFAFDDEVVCLGAGITAGGTNQIHTTIENRRLNSFGNNGLVVDGAAASASLGWSSNYSSLTWCTLEGAGGYYFPGGAVIEARRYSRTGRWFDINTLPQPTATVTNLITRNYLSLILNHGVRPTSSTYAYVLVPTASSSRMADYVAAPDITILENTPRVQAVRENNLGLVAANFWNPAPASVDFITCSTRASVMVRESGQFLTVAISDPTQTNTGTVTVSLDRAVSELVSADSGIQVLRLTPSIQLAVNVNGRKGQTLSARFKPVVPANQAPVLRPLPDGVAIPGTVFSVTNAATDPDVPAQQLKFTLLSGPPGAQVDAQTGVIRWEPTDVMVGTTNMFVVYVSEAGWSFEVPPTADAFVRDGSWANENYGVDQNLAVKLAGLGLNRETFLRFEVPAIPGLDKQARLKLSPVYGSSPGVHAAAAVQDGAWAENTMTWNSRPNAGSTVGFWTPQVGGVASVDVSGAVVPGSGSNQLVSLKIYATNSTADGLVYYASKESSVGAGPVLAITSTNHSVASATNSFRVRVISAVRPWLAPGSDGGWSLTATAHPGITYQVQTTTNLSSTFSWETVLMTNQAAGIFQFRWDDPGTLLAPHKFYRVVIGQ